MLGSSTYSSVSSSVQILIVEDERIVARDIRASLESLGYSVAAIATSGEEAIAKAVELQPDLILMDIQLRSDLDGIQAAETIWNRLKIPFIYATGYSDTSTLRRAKATGPFGYILKPIEERELYVAIETALQRYQLDTELKKREQWLTTILRGIGDGVIVVDAQARIKFLNLMAETLLGYSQATLQGQPLVDFFQIVSESTLTPVENPIIAALERGEIYLLPEQILLVTASGTRIPIADSAAPLRDEQGNITGAVLVFRDITDKRLAEERRVALMLNQQLQEQMLEMQRLSELKDDFLSTISHELRTPLTNIKMAIQMLEINFDRQSQQMLNSGIEAESTSRYLGILRDQCDRELALINDLLDFQRLNAEAYLLELSTVHLLEWITQLVENFQGRLQNRQLQLHLTLDRNVPPLISDLTSLSRIVTELLNNACKYTPPNEQILVAVTSLNANQVQLRICNTGVEIAAAELTRIFEPFYRIPRSDRWNQGGTGLGLPLIKKLATILGGTLRVESGNGQTCFYLELPLQPPTTSAPESN
ncbi:MAG: response regulator [Oscillatoriales cyanobacterium C42_A2020_001]|nr:response regulator [Leptolyngbyaceae cyanobacterium C42_A2020_001]